MSPRCRLSVALVALLCAIPGCKPPRKVEPITVRIFSDLSSPYGPALDHQILDFQATHPKLSNGTAIQVGSANIADLNSALKNMDEPAADIVIFNSPADATKYPALTAEMSHAVNVCAALQGCPAEVPALVPSKLEGEKAEAANKFVQFLAKQTPPAPAAPQSSAAPQQAPAAPNKANR